MEAKRCPNGHYFDTNKFGVCPFCGCYAVAGHKDAVPVGGAHGKVKEAYADIPPTMPFEESAASHAKKAKHEGAGNKTDATHTAADRDNGKGGAQDAPEATVAFQEKKLGFVPTVGWVVCIGGPQKGKEFRLKTGYNKIGRTADSAVCLSDDHQVSRESHAIIAYEPNSRKFFVAGDKNMIYLNGNFVLGGQELKANDRIKVGATELMFVPLCGEAFQWE